MNKTAKKREPTLADRARALGLGPHALATTAGLSRTTVWKALKANALPSRNAAAAKLRKALRMDEAAHA